MVEKKKWFYFISNKINMARYKMKIIRKNFCMLGNI